MSDDKNNESRADYRCADYSALNSNEQAGAPFTVASIFGVVWLYFILPVLFCLALRGRARMQSPGNC
jgi:hypothetical protein